MQTERVIVKRERMWTSIRKSILFCVISLLTASVFIGCRTESAATQTGRTPIRVFLLLISTNQMEYYRWAEQTYEAQNPDVDIIFEHFPGTSLKDYEIKLRLRFRARDAPDIFQFRENVLVEFERQGLLDPAPDYIVRMIKENSLNEFLRDGALYNGTYYGIAHDADWTALYYNKQMFHEAGLDPERPPRTWEEMLDYGRRLTKYRPDGSVQRAGISLRKTGYKPGTAEKWLTFFASAGGEITNNDHTEVNIDSKAGRAAMDLYHQILFEDSLDSVNLESDQQAFGQGLAAMFMREIHVVRWMREHHPDVEFGVAPIPALEASLTVGGGYPMVVSNDSKSKEQAWRFIEFLMSDEPYARYVRTAKCLPTTRSVAEMPEFASDPYLKVFLEQPVQPSVVVPRMSRANDILGAYVERFCYGHISGDEALKRATREINALLARNRHDTASREGQEETYAKAID